MSKFRKINFHELRSYGVNGQTFGDYLCAAERVIMHQLSKKQTGFVVASVDICDIAHVYALMYTIIVADITPYNTVHQLVR